MNRRQHNTTLHDHGSIVLDADHPPVDGPDPDHSSADGGDSTVPPADSPRSNHPGTVLDISTRVLLDSPSAPECRACCEQIDQGARYKCVTVRDHDGQVTDLPFCDERCLPDEHP